ncbi:hypothetical protein HA050_04115 [Iodobacter sp. HSC-16F04]|uniref:Uncharacterized protein n=1 Tax=Iodobacter violaceini TaxID=3044271 RepID=A0ABX0KNM0_9NEIS|nr:hypothetical protein [Iodobacter violacea]NHQ85296.1 hypothetical protein [Iodobacter violacea]
MNGRITFFSRLFIGLLAYFLCGLAFADYPAKNTERAGPLSYEEIVPFCTAQKPGYKTRFIFASSTPDMEYYACDYYHPDYKEWVLVRNYSFHCNYAGAPPGLIRKEGLVCKTKSTCDDKRNQSAGIYNIPIPGVKMPSTGGAAVLFDSGSFNSFSKSGFPTCIESCETVANGPPIKNSAGGNVVGDTAGNAYMRMQMKFSGSECTAKEGAPKPNGAPFPTDAPKPKEPNGPQDCPEGTSFGTISWGDGGGEVKRCLKTGAPSPPNPDGSPKPDACIGNCDKWDPKPEDPKDPKPTDPKDPSGPSGTGTGTGTGTRLPASGTSASSASSAASLSASCEAFKCVNSDPATCEIARLAWHEKCLEEKDRKELLDSALYKSGVAAMDASGTASIREALGFSGKPVDLEDVIKKTRFLTSGGLIDFNVVLMGHTVSIPISRLNKILEAMGNIAVAFTMLAAARIISTSLA